MKFKYLAFVLVLGVISRTTLQAKEYTVESVPNPKSLDGGYISDPENVLTAQAYTEINALFSELEKNTSNQVALVIVESIGTEVPKDFAYKLFNLWGIGLKGKDNGLLMLMVMDQRRIEFETGYGMETVLPDATCKSIQMNYMVPSFKDGDYNQGLLEGCKATVDIMQSGENSSYFLNMDATTSEEEDAKFVWTIVFSIFFFIIILIVYIVKMQRKTFLHNAKPIRERNSTVLLISRNYWLFLYVFIPLILIGFAYSFLGKENYFLNFNLIFYAYVTFILIEKWIRSAKHYSSLKTEDDFYSNYTNYVSIHGNGWWKALLFPVPFILYLIIYFSTKKRLRNHPRNCSKCSSKLVKLEEDVDDQHLSKAQVLEENLKSIDYDVWFCNSCSSKQVLSYKSTFSKYSECSKCSTKAYYMVSDVTLVSATYSSSGTGQKTYSCKYCNHTSVSTYTIPMKERSSSSSSGGGGSSYGGGSSGGGGSGSSW